MTTQEQIKNVAEKLKKETIKRRRAKLQSYLRSNASFFKSKQPPNLIRSIFDISQRNLPTYHNELDLEKALDVINLGKIYSAVEAKEKEQKDSGKYKDREGLQLDYSDFLVKELLQWYKNDFFKWVNSPECGNCHSANDVRPIGRANPTHEEFHGGGASVVEIYQCGKCQRQIRFPRYNNLSKLLDWRKGRCGEWNNCFLLLLNSLNIKCRYLWNLEDHVWCEYYSDSLKRWIHLDSCENSWDEPLLYNQGWGKKMSYVFAIGDDYIIDVSDKYIVKDQLPRKQLTESDLQKYLNFHNFGKWLRVHDDDELFNILAAYNIELRVLKPQVTTSDEQFQPRQSGLGEWTEQRGEAGK